MMKKTKVKVLKEFEELYNSNWRYIVYYGGRAGGKSLAVAQALLIKGAQRKLRILCTREVQNTIKDSVHKLLADLIDSYDLHTYQIKKDSIINLETGTEFIFKGLRHNVNEIKSTEGIDVCWVEEAQSITDHSIDILTPTIRKEGSQIIFTFNRFNELDPVYVRFVMNKPSGTYVKKVNYDILAKHNLLPDVILLEIENDRANPSLFAHKWLGEPISQDEQSIVSRDLALEAMNREVAPEGAIEIGVDVARMGNDRSVLWKRQGHKTLDFKVYQNTRTTELVDKIEMFAEDKSIHIKVDDTGVGGGVTDELLKRGYNVTAINFGATAKDKDKYPNLISEAWFQLAQNMKYLQLPFDKDLLMELTTRQWKQDSKGRRVVESKSEYKKRGFRSPDLADACIIAFYTPAKLSIDDIAM